MNTLRRITFICGFAGVAGILSIGLLSGLTQTVVAAVTVAALVISVIAGAICAILEAKPPRTVQVFADRRHNYAAQSNVGTHRNALLAVALTSTAIAQMWFTWGRSIAGGDIAPPNGTAWISQLFAPWSWTGSNLGAPNANASQLPWAIVAAAVHVAGGPAWFAQRLWVSSLYAGAAVAAYLLLRVLAIGPRASAVGAMVYVLNPFVMSSVGTNDVYLAAMLLLAAYPAAVLSAASGRISLRAAVAAVAAGAPLLGFAYANPPLAAMVAIVTVISIVVAAWSWGRHCAVRAAIVVLLGGLTVGLLSAYWIVPSLLQVSVDATGRLSSLSAWTWTEGRATLTNGLWLNTTWGWKFPTYYPFAPSYTRFPLSFIKFLPSAAGFAALPLVAVARSSPGNSRTRLVLAAAGGDALPDHL